MQQEYVEVIENEQVGIHYMRSIDYDLAAASRFRSLVLILTGPARNAHSAFEPELATGKLTGQ